MPAGVHSAGSDSEWLLKAYFRAANRAMTLFTLFAAFIARCGHHPCLNALPAPLKLAEIALLDIS